MFNVAFTADRRGAGDVDIFLVNDFLAAKQWRMNGLQHPPAVHFCVTRPNTQPGVVDRFAPISTRPSATPASAGAPAPLGRHLRRRRSEHPREKVAAGVSGWLDATQALPPA